MFDMYQNILGNVSFVCLFLSTIFNWISLVFSKYKIIYRLSKFSSIIANIVLFGLLGSRWMYHGYFPLSNLYESLLFLSWTLLFLYLILEYKTDSKILGAIIIPVTLLINGFATLTLPLEMQKASALVPALQSNWLMMHVSLMMLSYATLIIGSILAILYLIITFKNKITLANLNQNINVNTYLPKLLKSIDNLSYRIISLGFPFLTIGIIAGAVWANEAWGSYWSWDPKETWALITWLIFAAYLHARIIKGWEGEKPAILGSLGFFVVWICYLGVNFLGQGLHSYGWLS
ncbi:unnamed protein product [Chrysoparadoxa australica]